MDEVGFPDNQVKLNINLNYLRADKGVVATEVLPVSEIVSANHFLE